MSLLPFNPENELDERLIQAKSGKVDMADILKQLLQENIYVLSKEEVQSDGSGFVPLLLEGQDGPLVAVFSALPHATIHRDAAQHALQMNGRDFISRMPPGYGLVLNPGFTVHLVIPKNGIETIKADLR
ncbi:SseB family protein [Asticcacaulis solisilvae]|uniref:SseB family protein n=1 Tax=Asticcacaulis solisilvae TaxID=1217274 RepID=UPI003FD86F9E